MTLKLLVMLVSCVSITTLSQLFMKLGVSAPSLQAELARGVGLPLLLSAATNGYILIGVVLYALAAGFWLIILSQADLSLVYPFVGLGFVLIMLIGWWLLDEPLNAAKVIGTLLIATGVLFVARA